MLLRFTLPIPPGKLAINRRYEPQVRRRRDGSTHLTVGTTGSSEAAFDEAVFCVRQAVASQAWKTRESFVDVTIVSMWPEEKGDLDSPCKMVLDALQAGGVVINDRLVASATLMRVWLAPPGEIVVTVKDVEP